MKCFVHVDYDPMPKEAESASDAIQMAEKLLRSDDEEDPSSRWLIRWRRDELYPNNYAPYSNHELISELNQHGYIVLQLVSDNGEDLGKSVEILSDDLERKYDEEAASALCVDGCKSRLNMHGVALRRKIRLLNLDFSK
jgi:hypothetical protein